jgi:hypothetical protein
LTIDSRACLIVAVFQPIATISPHPHRWGGAI